MFSYVNIYSATNRIQYRIKATNRGIDYYVLHIITEVQ
jgi:hypothetical protein